MHPGGEMVDARDLKSLGRKAVPVRVRPRVFAVQYFPHRAPISRPTARIFRFDICTIEYAQNRVTSTRAAF